MISFATGGGDSRDPRSSQNRSFDAPPKGRELEGLSILVVEDEEPAAKLFSIILSASGAVVRVVHSAEEALVVLDEWRPRFVVMDLVLPRMSGLVLAKVIRSLSWAGDMIVVAVSGLDGLETAPLAREFGCDAYFRKPIDIETFPAAIAALLPSNRN